MKNPAFIPEDYGRLTRLSSLTLAPDGAVACVKYFWRDGAWQRRTVMIKGRETREISLDGTVEKCPAFSRDGKRLWFLSDGRIALYDRETEETKDSNGCDSTFPILANGRKETRSSDECMLTSGEDRPLPYKLPARSISSC